MAAEIVKTIRASGGDYSTYNGWVVGEGRDLVDLDEIAVAEIYNDWADGGLAASSPASLSTGNGWLTGPDNYVVMRAAAGHQHNGQLFDSDGEYTGANLVATGSSTFTLTTTHARFEKLIMRQSSVTTSARNVMTTTIGTGGAKPANLLVFDSCVFGVASSNNRSGCIRSNGRRDIVATNCVAYEGNIHFSVGGHSQANGWLLNCTSVGARTGFNQGDSGSTVQIINCLADDAAVAGFNAPTATVQNCATSDTSLPSGDGNRNSQTFTFEDDANHDYRLTALDAGARTHGQDLSAYSPYPFSVDALGAARGSVWDIGAFQVTSAGPQPPEGATTITSATPTDEGVAGAFSYDDSDATGFEYQVDAGSWTDLGDPDPRLFNVTGQAERTDYTIRIRPYNAQGPGAPSDPIAYRTLPDVRLFDLQEHDAQIGTVDGDQIALPTGTTRARTYALYESGGTFSEIVLHADWEGDEGDEYAAELTAPAVAMQAQTVTVEERTPYDADLTAPAAAMQAQTVTVEERAPYIAELTAPGVGMAGQAMTQTTGFSALLSAAGVAMTGMSAERRTGVNQQLTAPALGLSPQPANTVAMQSYVAELSAAALQLAGQAATWSASFIAELTAAAFSASGRAVTWTGPFVASLLPASLSMQGRQAEQRTGLIQQLTAGAFGFAAQAAQQVATFTAMLQAAALSITSQAANAMTSFAAQLTAPTLRMESASVEYSSTLSYVAQLTAAVVKSTPTDLLVLRAYIADLTAAVFSMRARATEVEGVAEKVRRFMKTWRRRGRRL